jgi:peptide-methionine (S)-S-oxide reductase
MRNEMMKIGVGAALGVAVYSLLSSGVMASEAAVIIPAPRIDQAATKAKHIAVLAGGCFWGMEGVFEHVKGVLSVKSGYAGGTAADANYSAVSSEATRHAEAVQIIYDPAQISYGKLLQVYFSVAHDPTQLNRQGPDSGTSYRSAIFPQSQEQTNIARAYIAQLGAAKAWKRPIVTKLEAGKFFPAEEYHQNFMKRNPDHGYIRTWDVPKLAAYKAAFPRLYQ